MKRTLMVCALSAALVACGGETESGGEPATGVPDATASGTGDGVATGSDSGTSVDPNAPLPSRCVEAIPWAPGTPAFRDATDDWGLHDMGVVGILVHVTELDGDGWPDLIIHQEGGNDVFGPEESRATWVLRNLEGQGFQDVTMASGFRMRRIDEGLNKGRAGQMMGSADVDNDGDLDIFTAGRFEEVSATRDSSELMLNDGYGHFSFGPEDNEARRQGQRDFANSLSFTDFDRDGFIDLWVVNNVPIAELWATDDQQDRLYQGMGTGSFVDVTAPLGLSTSLAYNFDILNNAQGHSWGWAASACDLNDDGMPELLAAAYGRTPNQLWQAAPTEAGGVFYSNQSIASGFAWDDNEEWWLDLNARCHCKDNPGDAECEKTVPPEGTLCSDWWNALGGYRWDHAYSREPFMLGGVSASAECADINNDGHMDLLTGEIVHPDIGPAADQATLLVNTGELDVRFERQDHNAIGLGRPFLGQGRDEGVMNNA
ncbi:MAG: VCBS repeat-containing protein, partial [Myxococcota bacterium]|nr:VCBS repeat-containing protein [Myxococcota bacterium]